MFDITGAFLKVFNLSITASWFVLAILILRRIFKKAPKSIFCFLWLLVGIRLAFPFSIESIFSLIPSAEVVSPEIIYNSETGIQTGFETVNPVISENLVATPEYSISPIQTFILAAAYIWRAVMAILLLYGLISYISLKIKVREAIPLEGNIRQSERINSPFILGFLRPKIYIPFGMDENNLDYVLAHERAHLKRRDHLTKPIGFALLSVYWFNPIIWVAYIFLCRDIELACDEKVVRDFEADERARYATALLDCSISRRSITACPLAFGEVGVKERIKNALSYKKPMLLIIIAAVVSALIITVCFMTNPKADETDITETNPETGITETTPEPEIETNTQIKKVGYATELAKYMCENEDGNACIKISSLKELDEFLAELNSNPFKDITDVCDKGYFENNILLAVYYTSASGSFQYEIENVDIDHSIKKITVSTLLTMPEVYTYDMSGWLGIIEIKNIDDTEIRDYDCTTEVHSKQYSSPILKKDSIEKTDHWKTEGLKSAGLENVEITYDHKFSHGTLYLLEEKEQFYVGYKQFFFAVETEEQILFSAAGAGTAQEYINCCDVDGEEGDEIIFMVDYGGNGGAGAHGTFVYKVTQNKINNIFYSDYFNDSHGFSAKIIAPYRVKVTNSITGYNTIINIENPYGYYSNDDGNSIYNEIIGFDCINNVQPRDVDNDGISELICTRYSYLGVHVNFLGDAVTTLKYDKSNGAFKVIDAEFVPFEEKEGTLLSDFYEVLAFTQKPTDSSFSYTYTIFDKDKNILTAGSTNRKPNIEQISENVLRLYIQ